MNIEVDGRMIEAQDGETILSALHRANIKVPTLCHMPELTPTGACRICVVEVEGMPNLVPSCSYPVAAGMKIHTSNPRVLEARRMIVELLVASHPDDCLYCVRGGNCDLQALTKDMGVRHRFFRTPHERKAMDVSSASIIRDPEKCILCGRCVRLCEEVQGVAAIDFVARGSKAYVGTPFDNGLNVSTCINCGQCILVCPTGALTEQSHLDSVVAALNDPEKYVVVQHAPAVSVSLGEEFGVAPGEDVDGMMVAALRRIGFKRVFDTSFTADLTIMEEASELVQRITTGGKLPMLTSCSPGWIKFVEQEFPDFIPNLSTCKSPQQMMGALIKSFFAQREKIDPAKIVSVSIMPCTAKKFECGRPEMTQNEIPDVDYVLTTREAGRLLRRFGVNLVTMEPETADTPFGERSSAGKIFGATGGVMEAAVRTAYHMITGKELEDLKIVPLRGLKGCKELHVEVSGIKVGAVVVSGLGNARRMLEQFQGGRSDIQFMEVMTCPGGCVAGGGQPIGTDQESIKARMQMLYKIDRDDRLRTSHSNESVKRLYKEFLVAPLGEKSHHLLHTHYHQRAEESLAEASQAK